MFTSESEEVTKAKQRARAQAWESAGRKDIHVVRGHRDESAHASNDKCGPDESQVPSRSKTLIPKFHGGAFELGLT